MYNHLKPISKFDEFYASDEFLKFLRESEELSDIKDYEPLYTFNERNLRDYERKFYNIGQIELPDGMIIDPKEIITIVNKALETMKYHMPTLCEIFLEEDKIIYTLDDSFCSTMCVNEKLFIFVNAKFVKGFLQMNHKYVAIILFHELFHIVYNHVERSKNWLAAQGKPMTRENWRDTNLAADAEVNKTLILKDLCSENVLRNELLAVMLDRKSSISITMEMILESPELMEQLRKGATPPPGGGGGGGTGGTGGGPEEDIETTPEWDEGFKKGWDKIAELIDKYGAKDTYKKLIDNKIINSDGEIITKDINDLLNMNYIVKSFSTFLFESKDNEFKTYDDGVMKGVAMAAGALKNALYPPVGPPPPPPPGGGGGGGGGGQIKTGLKDDDLRKLKLPPQKGGQQGGQQGGEGGIPQNIEQDIEDTEGPDGQVHKPGGKSGGNSNSLIDDLEKKLRNGGSNSKPKELPKSNNGGDGVGGTGSFMDESNENKIKQSLKRSGYSDDDVKKIVDEVRSENTNSSENLKKRREELRASIKSPIDKIGQLLDAIDVSSKKYKNVWESIMKKFMQSSSRYALKGVTDYDNIRGYRPGRHNKDIYSVKYPSRKGEPQFVNMYVDTSGSMDKELIEIIAKSLVIFCDSYKYTGINVIPWSDSSPGALKIEMMKSNSKEKITKDILGYLGENMSGGTDLKKAFFPQLVDLVERSKKKDDIHIIITDGETFGTETEIEGLIKNECGVNIAKRCFWMIYTTNYSTHDSWEKSIETGQLVFLNPEVVKNNKNLNK